MAMGDLIKVSDLRIVVEGETEPRVLDIRIAERLGYERPRDIRKLIERGRQQLERYGICATVAQNTGDRGRPATEYWLNEGQAIQICIDSETPYAKDAQFELVTVFKAWRHGELAPTSGLVTLPGMRDLFEKVNATHEIVKASHAIIKERDENVVTLVRISSDTNQIVRDWGPRRTKVPPKNIRLYIEVIELPPYYSHCPIYPEIEIVHNGEQILGVAELDHTEGRNNTALKFCWLTSLLANQHLRNPDFRKLHRSTFEAFQNNLRLHLEYKKRKQKEHQRGRDQSLSSFNPDRAMTADEMRNYKSPRLPWDK